MTNIPELTDAEAAVIRYVIETDPEAPTESRLRANGCLGGQHHFTVLGIRALAAYDAKKRAAIRVEAMRECEEIALANLAVDPPYDHELEVQENIAEAIREKIAKEQSP